MNMIQLAVRINVTGNERKPSLAEASGFLDRLFVDEVVNIMSGAEGIAVDFIKAEEGELDHV